MKKLAVAIALILVLPSVAFANVAPLPPIHLRFFYPSTIEEGALFSVNVTNRDFLGRDCTIYVELPEEDFEYSESFEVASNDVKQVDVSIPEVDSVCFMYVRFVDEEINETQRDEILVIDKPSIHHSFLLHHTINLILKAILGLLLVFLGGFVLGYAFWNRKREEI